MERRVNELDGGEPSTELLHDGPSTHESLDADFLVPGDMELQAGTVEEMPLQLGELVAFSGDVGGGCGQVDDLDTSFLSDLLPPVSSAIVEPLPASNESEDSSPAPDSLSSDAANNSSSSTDEVAVGVGIPKRTKTFESSAFQEIVEGGEADDEQEGRLVDRKARRRAQIASSARRVRSKKKYEMMSLKTEATLLEQQLEALRSKHKQMRASNSVAAREEQAITQRLKRRQAEQINEHLQQALFTHTSYVKNLRSIFAESAPPSAALNMRHFLRKYTHLRKDPQLRARDLEAVGTAAKLDRAMQVVLRETSTISVSTSPEILFQELNLGAEGLGKTSSAVYAFNTRNASNAFEVACKAILSTCGVWPNYTRVEASTKFIDVPCTEFNVMCSISKHRYVHNSTNEQACIETRDLYYSRMVGSCGVLVWDYVDSDDLYPLKASTFIKRNTVGALVIRPEVCPDGVERMVCRSVCTEMKVLGNVPRPALDVAEAARIEDIMIFMEMKGRATDWNDELTANF